MYDPVRGWFDENDRLLREAQQARDGDVSSPRIRLKHPDAKLRQIVDDFCVIRVLVLYLVRMSEFRISGI